MKGKCCNEIEIEQSVYRQGKGRETRRAEENRREGIVSGGRERTRRGERVRKASRE